MHNRRIMEIRFTGGARVRTLRDALVSNLAQMRTAFSEHGHNGSGTEGNRSVKAAQKALEGPTGIPIARPQNYKLVKR